MPSCPVLPGARALYLTDRRGVHLGLLAGVCLPGFSGALPPVHTVLSGRRSPCAARVEGLEVSSPPEGGASIQITRVPLETRLLPLPLTHPAQGLTLDFGL